MSDYSLTILARRIRAVAERANAAWDIAAPSMNKNIEEAVLRECGVANADGTFAHTRESRLITLLLCAAWNDVLSWARETISEA